MSSQKFIFLKKEIIQALLVGFFSALIALILWSFGTLDMWEAKTWDWRASTMAKPSEFTNDICLILLDQKSLDLMSKTNSINWPWPREIYSVIVDFCKRNKAKALGFDVLFTEPSSYGVEDDLAFGSAVADFGKVALAGFVKKGVNSSEQEAVMPIAEIASNSAVICDVQQLPDADGIYRRVKMATIFKNSLMPMLGLGTYFAGEDRDVFKSLESTIDVNSNTLKIGNKRAIQLDKNREAILRYRGPSSTHKAYSAFSIIQSEIEFQNGNQSLNDQYVQDFKAKYVLFGFSAPGLFDLRSSPVDSVYTGVEIQATILDNFLAGDFICDAQKSGVILWVVTWAIICSISINFVKGSTPLFFASSSAITLPIFISFAGYYIGIWFPLVVQEVGSILAVLISLGVNYIREGRQRRFIKSAFSQYLSPIFIEQLIQNPEKLKLGGERKELSIFFSDLEGFTSISERLSPEELTSLLNSYLSAMTEIIHQEGGTVDKYEGDAIIAFWNAPLDVPNHRVCALRAALRCQKSLANMNPQIKKVVGKDVRMRIGLNTGVVVVGNMGSNSRFDYTMLGDAVNLAARLEGANKEFGTYTMVSQFTRHDIKGEFAFREVARLAVVGKKEAVTVFEPIYLDEFEANKNIYKIYDDGLQLFYKGRFRAALELFSEISDKDAPAAAYVKKCNQILLDNFDNNSQPNFNGVWVMTKK
ncbi:MAG: adenylate/guanylate cyclase domain-containing protein [Desulfamplus sp.]|nr:adenylate/guanylate cyclase domain-containing protein [Desulfamplus sp.]